MPTVETEPYVFEFDSRTTVLVIIPMQRDFVDQGWYVRRVRVDVSIPELMATDDSSARNVAARSHETCVTSCGHEPRRQP